jgi:hypothetical protein
MAETDGPSPQAQSPSYTLAEQDLELLAHDRLRPVRMQLELLKPELYLQEEGVESTVVVFGSARIPAPEDAEEKVKRAAQDLAKDPEDLVLQQKLRAAEGLKKLGRYYEEARKFAALVSSRCQIEGHCDYVMVTGGGPGIMEAANRGAHEVGAKSIGLNIELEFEQEPNRYITPRLCFQFHYFALRKMHFLLRAKALVCFPGGFGTMDELFDALTLIQTKKSPPIPVILVGGEFWNRVLNFPAFVELGVISPEDLELFSVVETAEDAWQVIADHYSH